MRHTFASGTTLGAGRAIAVYGGASGIPPGLSNAVAARSGGAQPQHTSAHATLRNGGAIRGQLRIHRPAGTDGVP